MPKRYGDGSRVRRHLHYLRPRGGFHRRGSAYSIELPRDGRSLTQAKPNPKALATHAELSGLDSRFIELAEMVAEGEVTGIQYQAAMKVVLERKGELEKILAKERGVIELAGDFGSPRLIV